ncbi:MAG TPA: peptidoglycan-binding domain-containing protein [Gaiellales bacterium]|nr:peptidoglycan-binding domain-containing protein [Gaiellales bacterium]
MSVATDLQKTRGTGASVRERLLHTHRRLLAGAAVLLFGVGVVVVVVNPFAGTASGHGGAVDNGSPTSTRRVERTSLSSQTQVSGTLGYAGSWMVSVPAAAPGQAVYTMLPSAGRIVRRGQPLFMINGEPTLLLYGSTAAWRAFQAGMSPGMDVAELNANLRALGFGAPSGDAFTWSTSAAISALQQAHGLTRTGTLLLGAVVFEPGVLRVSRVTATLGAPAQPGPVLAATSTRQHLSVQLDAAQQSEVNVGDRVSVTLPDSRTTPGVVSAIGKVATTPSSDQQGGGSSSPTIDVTVRLLHPSAAGTLDQAPVEVSITEQSVSNALAVPVNALVALAGGGYAVEEVEANGTHRLVAVTPGLFDDAQGLVQVAGSGLTVGQRVVVPAS